jgi:hypothetical protein
MSSALHAVARDRFLAAPAVIRKTNPVGYDFMFMRLNRRVSRTFPLSCALLEEADCDGVLPWTGFRAWLLTRGGRENGDADSIWVEYDDRGSINFSGKPASVYLDVHTDWQNVLEAYEAMAAHDPDTAILDIQSGDFHDDTSFRELMRQDTTD